MLKSLRRKFVVIIMTIVGIALLSVLGSSYVSSWQTQHDLITEALERKLGGETLILPPQGDAAQEKRVPIHQNRANVLTLVIDLDPNGIVLSSNNVPIFVDSTTLSSMLVDILAADADSAWDDTNHIAWMRRRYESDAWRVVIADTSTVDVSLQSLAVRDVCIFAVAMGVMLVLCLRLSTWALRPVKTAWEQQRRFIADASHELKTPLAVIIANTQILKSDEAIPEESMRWINSTADESEHMKNLVEELLELARTDETTAGAKGVMHTERIDFSAMVENACLEFDAIAFERGNTIEESIDEDVFVEGDREWLTRLCKILVDNACKYSYVGCPIHVSLRKEQRRCVLSVNNQGNVIDEQDLPHVFDRFYRTDKARSRNEQTGGFGLGLAIAQGICTSHSGTIAVTSTEADGTTFTATLPLAKS